MSTALDQLIKSALIGLARKSPTWPQLDGEIGALLADLESADAEFRLLRSAGILALAAEAGLTLPAATNMLPEAPPEPDLPLLSPKLQATLENILQEGPELLMDECLDLLAKKPKQFPATLLPKLFDAAVNKPALRSALAKLNQPRAVWLHSLNPDWKKLPMRSATATTETLSEQLWQEGTLTERIDWLTQTRTRAPALAREALAAVLPQEAAKERAELLAAMKSGLSIEDEPMLDGLLTDKSKQVREMAQALLSQLPESSMAGRMAERWRAITVKKPFQISPPEKFDPSWAKDGIEEKPARGEGAKAFWLRQIVSLTPLKIWLEHGFATPRHALQALDKSDWKEPVLRGLLTASVQQNNTLWADMMIVEGGALLPSLDLSSLLKIASLPSTEAWLLDQASGQNLPAALQYAAHLRPWSPGLCQGLLAACKRSMGHSNHDYYLHNLLPGLAACVPVSHLESAQQHWPETTDYFFQKPLESFRSILQMRQTLHQELA